MADPHTGNSQIEPNPGPVSGFLRQDPMPENLNDITVLESNDRQVKFKISFPDVIDYEIAQGDDGRPYRRYKADTGFKVIASVGEPEILNRIVRIQVPADAKDFVVNVEQQVLKGEKAEQIALYPVPETVIDTTPNGFSGGREVFRINKELYEKDLWSPDTGAQMIETGIKHDLKMVSLAVPVMAYNPALSMIQEFKEVVINVTYTSSLKSNRISMDTARDPFHKVFVSTIPNYAYDVIPPSAPLVGVVRELLPEDLANEEYAFAPDYLVIAATAFHESGTSEALLQWADHRKGDGGNHNIAIAYVDDIKSVYQTHPKTEENIREFIQMVYDHWRVNMNAPSLNFLLLVGDTDHGGQQLSWFLPMWRMNEEGSAGDNDYSWLVGEDCFNDVMMGRFPAKDEAELDTMVEKTINFELNAPSGENHYGTRTLLLYGDCYERSVAPVDFSNVARNILLSNKQELDEFHTDYLRKLSPFKYNSGLVTGILNDPDKGALFVGYSAHGDEYGWYPSVFVEALENAQQLPVLVLSNACLTARIDWTQDCFGEKWLKHDAGGSVAFFGATRIGGSMGWIPYFMDAVFLQHMYTLGQAVDFLRLNLDRQSQVGGDQERKKHILLGDPAVNFSAHIGQSTKPDLVMGGTTHAPQFPVKTGELINIATVTENRSETVLNDVPVNLYSVDGGLFNLLKHWDISSLPPIPDYKTDHYFLPYQAESSRHFVSWVDPEDNLDELSEFNNWLNGDIAYFPIHVDAANHSGVEQGTQEHPFKDLETAINYAQATDRIGDAFLPDLERAVEINLAKGEYGAGDHTIACKSIVLKGKNGASRTVIKDALNVNGDVLKVQDLTFDGRQQTQSGRAAIFFMPSTEVSYTMRPGHLFFRNIFRNWNLNQHAVSITQGPELKYPSRYTFTNNIFHDNFGTISLIENSQSTWNSALFVVNNTMTLNSTNLYFFSDHNNHEPLSLMFLNNIAWQSGDTTGSGAFPLGVSAGVMFNNMDDNTLLQWPNASFNQSEDPLFRDLLRRNFQLRADSPSIDEGHNQPEYNDPDGSRNDQGAHGGPQAIIRPVRITRPIDDSTININSSNPVTLSIKWEAYKIPFLSSVNIYMYHMEYTAIPDKGGVNYQGNKVVDIDNVSAQNDGTYIAVFDQAADNQLYYLTISDPDRLEDAETISFKIMRDTFCLQDNR